LRHGRKQRQQQAREREQKKATLAEGKTPDRERGKSASDSPNGESTR